MEKDYKRAFYIACELLNGTNFYGIDAEKIFEICMKKDGVVDGNSYRDYILNHLDEIDHGEYKESLDCTDCVLDGTDACPRGAGRAVDSEVCEDFLKEGEEE